MYSVKCYKGGRHFKYLDFSHTCPNVFFDYINELLGECGYEMRIQRNQCKYLEDIMPEV